MNHQPLTRILLAIKNPRSTTNRAGAIPQRLPAVSSPAVALAAVCILPESRQACLIQQRSISSSSGLCSHTFLSNTLEVHLKPLNLPVNSPFADGKGISAVLRGPFVKQDSLILASCKERCQIFVPVSPPMEMLMLQHHTALWVQLWQRWVSVSWGLTDWWPGEAFGKYPTLGQLSSAIIPAGNCKLHHQSLV